MSARTRGDYKIPAERRIERERGGKKRGQPQGGLSGGYSHSPSPATSHSVRRERRGKNGSRAERAAIDKRGRNRGNEPETTSPCTGAATRANQLRAAVDKRRLHGATVSAQPMPNPRSLAHTHSLSSLSPLGSTAPTRLPLSLCIVSNTPYLVLKSLFFARRECGIFFNALLLFSEWVEIVKPPYLPV